MQQVNSGVFPCLRTVGCEDELTRIAGKVNLSHRSPTAGFTEEFLKFEDVKGALDTLFSAQLLHSRLCETGCADQVDKHRGIK